MPKISREHLGSHRLLISQAALLSRHLGKLATTNDFKRYVSATVIYEQLLVALASAIALYKRRICPAWLKDNALFIYWQNGGTEFIVDDTHFANKLTQILAPLNELSLEPEFFPQLDRIIHSKDYEPLFSSPLLVAWLYQCLLQKPRKTILGTEQNPQSAKAEDVCLSKLPQLTQWFTPAWISRFLVEETLKDTSEAHPSLCDPACGAGNILVEALQFLFSRQMQTNGGSEEETLSTIFDRQLVGFDIDPFIIDQAGFALYLAARDIAPPCELPIPKLFHFGAGELNTDSAIGSLYLGLEEIPKHIVVQQIGSATPLPLYKIKQDFSAVATNPPYLGHRLMPKTLSTFIKANYFSARFDIYSAFLIACTKMLKKNGRMGLICQQSFLSIKRYEGLRQELLSKCRIQSLVQLGSGTFAAKQGEKVSNAIIIATTNLEANDNEHSTRCWMLVDAQAKEKAEAAGINSIECQDIPASSVGILPGSSLAFWCPPDLARLFADCQPLDSKETGIVLTNGLFTCDNDRFVKWHWQVEKQEAADFVAYDKGGGQKWYRRTPYCLNWQDNGNVIRNFRLSRGQSKSLPGESFYFQQGITYSYIGTSGFAARLLSPNSVFDIASSSLFSKRIDLYYLLAFLNSSLVRFLLGVLNPTVNFQIGDLRRLPFIEPPDEILQDIAEKAKQAISLARELDRLDPLSPDYVQPVLLRSRITANGSLDLKQAYVEHIKFLVNLNDTEAQIQKEIDKSIFKLYSVNKENQDLILKDFWVAGNKKKLAATPSLQDCLKELINYLNRSSEDNRWLSDLEKPDQLSSQAKQLLEWAK